MFMLYIGLYLNIVIKPILNAPHLSKSNKEYSIGKKADVFHILNIFHGI